MRRTVFALAAAALASGAVYVALLPGEAPAPVVTAEPEPAPPAAAAIPVKKPSPPRANFDAVQESLPTSEKLAALSESQVHNTPPELIDASRHIGELVAAVQKDPSLEPQALDFYGKCARRVELPLSVRAHCLHNLRALSKKRGETADESGITNGVLKLEGP